MKVIIRKYWCKLLLSSMPTSVIVATYLYPYVKGAALGEDMSMAPLIVGAILLSFPIAMFTKIAMEMLGVNGQEGGSAQCQKK